MQGLLGQSWLQNILEMGASSDIQGRQAPGIDRLTVKFYKEYWDVLGSPSVLLKSSCDFAPKRGKSAGGQELAPGVPFLCGLQNPVQDAGLQAERSHVAGHPLGPDLLCTWQVHGRTMST